MTGHRQNLRAIRTFPSLVRYLRERDGLAHHVGDFEDLTFDYSPEELGIDAEKRSRI